jgi:hypothetical protein
MGAIAHLPREVCNIKLTAPVEFDPYTTRHIQSLKQKARAPATEIYRNSGEKWMETQSPGLRVEGPFMSEHCSSFKRDPPV